MDRGDNDRGGDGGRFWDGGVFGVGGQRHKAHSRTHRQAASLTNCTGCHDSREKYGGGGGGLVTQETNIRC